uniref:Uncharacterized protein n=1 Tax=Panagrolaimus sp. JU765 TaxID=591449 RepID=A0AC34R133_9BILA
MLKPYQTTRAFHSSTVRFRTAKFKPKISRSKPIKTPSMLALDNFDFYYGPLYGEQWPSIRLGLLTPNKFVAVLNRFSQSKDVNEQILKDLGTVNIMKFLRSGTSEKTLENLEKRKAEILKKPLQSLEGDVLTEEEAFGKN